MISTLRASAARLPRPAVTLAALAVVAAALPLAGGELAPTAARAALGAAVIGAALLALRRRARAAAPAPEIAVVARAALGRDASLALIEVAGRRVLVGFGGGAVSLVAELGGPRSEGRPT